MLPPGAARLFTKPEPTGSTFCTKIIGIVCVSCMTAAVTGVEMTTITLGPNATSSLARAFIASTEPPTVFRSERCGVLSIPMLAVPGRARHYSGALRNHLQLPTAIWQLEDNVLAAARAL